MKEERKGMIDNKMGKIDRQRGIERVLQKGHEKREGHDGKMGSGSGKGSFKRSDSNMTPCKG
jgi:hypothetical protein